MMATGKPNRTQESAPPKEGGMTQTRRWLVFGSNVAVAIVLATILAAVVVWMSGTLLRGRTRSDWTATGRFSLSPRSKNLLADLPCDVRLTNLYSHAPEVPASEEQYQRVQDLLEEYGTASTKVTVEAVNPAVDAGGVEKLVTRLRDRYADELEAPKALVGEFSALHQDLGDAMAAQAKRLNAAADAWKDGNPDAVGALRMVSQRWQQLKVVGDFTASGIKSLTDQALPAYTTALTRAKEYLKQVRENFGALPDLCKQIRDLVKDAPLPDPVKSILDDTETYTLLIQRIEAFEKKGGDVKESGLDAIRRDIADGEVVLIETSVPKGVLRVRGAEGEALRKIALDSGAEKVTPAIEKAGGAAKPSTDAFEVITPPEKLQAVKEALAKAKIPVESAETVKRADTVKVVAFDDIWVRNPRQAAEEETPERLFAGEQAVSSALLGVCYKKRPALLFVSAGAPATSGTPPMMGGGMRGPYMEMADRLRKANFIVEDWNLMRGPEMPDPPDASKRILVLVPPPPPNPQRPTPPPSPEQYKPIIDLIKGGAPAILMGEPSNMFQPQVPYAELFADFGVDAKFGAVAVHNVVVDAAGTEKAIPQIEITAYAPHEIASPLGALPSIVLTASPLVIKGELPEGVTAEPILNMPGGRDYWADTVAFEAMRGQAKRHETDDIAGPVPLVVAATRKIGDETQKVVLFGDGDFAQDRVAFYRDMLGREMFPGNSELFLNACLWVSGKDHLITVSPEALQARRIGEMGGWTLPLQIIVIAGLPALVLIAGIVVYVVRRG